MKILIFSILLLGALSVFALQYVSSLASGNDRALYQRARLSTTSFGSKAEGKKVASAAPSEFFKTFNGLTNEVTEFFSVISSNLLTPSSVDLEGLETLPLEVTAGLRQQVDRLSQGFVTPSKLNSIVKRSPWVESSSYSWGLFPFRVSIEAIPAEPWIVAEFDSNSWLLSREEKLLADLRLVSDSEIVTRAGELPRVSGLESSEGFRNFLSSENSRLRYACRLIHNIQRAHMLPFEVVRYELEFDGSLLIHPLEKNQPKVLAKPLTVVQAEALAKKVKAVLLDVEGREERIELLDLRFGSQVIVR